MSWNFDEKVEEGVECVLGGKRYLFRYPTTEEVLKARQVKEDDQLDYLFQFISPIDADAPDFKTTLMNSNVLVLKQFTKMVKEVLKVD